MNVYKLEAAIGLNTTEYQKGLKTAGESMTATGDKIKLAAANISKVACASFAAIAGAATATTAAVVKGVDAYSKYGDNIDKMSQKLNMSAQAYQEWDAVMQHSGANIESMGAAIKTLSAALETESDVFAKLGLDASALRGMSSEQLFETTITALQNVDSETERTYLASKLLGRGAVELGALLNTSAEDTQKMRDRVHELGGVMSDEAVKAAAKYRDSLQDMKTAFSGLGRSLGAEFLPAFTKISDGLTGIFSGDEDAAELVTEGIDNALDTLGTSAARMKPIAKKIGGIAVKAIPEIVSTIGKGLIKAAPDLLTSTSSMMKMLYSAAENAELGPFDWVRDDALSVIDDVRSTFKNIDWGNLKDSFGNLGGSFNNAFSRIGDGIAWASENVVSPLVEWGANDVLPKVFDSLAASIDICTAAIDFMKPAAEWLWDNFLEPLAGDAGDVIAGTLDLISKGLGAVADEFSGVDWSGYWKDIDNGEFFANWERGAKSIGDLLSDNADAIDDFFNEGEFGRKWNEFWQHLGASVQEQHETIDNALFITTHYINEFTDAWKTGKKEITDAVDAIGRKYSEFKNMWGVGADSIKDEITDADSVGGIAYQIFKNKIPFFGDGGRVTHPTLAIVGEKEPETIVPDSKRGAFGNTTQNISVTINGAYNIEDPESRRSLVEEMSRELANLGINQKRAVGGAGW